MNAEMNTQMTERFNVSGALLVKLFGRHDDEISAFSGRAARVRNAGIKSAMYGRVFFVALGLVGALGAAVIYGVGAHLVVSGSITDGTLVALAAFSTRVYQPLTGLTNARVDLMTALISFERVFEVLDAPVAVADRPDAVELPAPVGRVEFDHVRFRYPPAHEVSVASLEAPGTYGVGDPDTDVLHDVSLTIEPGETVALVGSSGAGKSTLASLLPRLYDVTAGAVRVDGHDVRELTGASLRAAIGVVSQDPHLFHESVAANLRYAKPDATDAELVAACRAARIHDTIHSLSEGYDTIVGERGYRLSGGEKQRLAIARLLLKAPAIVVLDEATSHLAPSPSGTRACRRRCSRSRARRRGAPSARRRWRGWSIRRRCTRAPRRAARRRTRSPRGAGWAACGRGVRRPRRWRPGCSLRRAGRRRSPCSCCRRARCARPGSRPCGGR